MSDVVLLSGGLDSTVLLAASKVFQREPVALTVHYGQRNEAEIAAARAVAGVLGVEHLEVRIGEDEAPVLAVEPFLPGDTSGAGGALPPPFGTLGEDPPRIRRLGDASEHTAAQR